MVAGEYRGAETFAAESGENKELTARIVQLQADKEKLKTLMEQAA